MLKRLKVKLNCLLDNVISIFKIFCSISGLRNEEIFSKNLVFEVINYLIGSTFVVALFWPFLEHIVKWLMES